MSSLPPLPPPLEHSGDRSFSFYPPILNVEHNEWQFRQATWSEILVVNTKTGAELWVPRRFVGEVSRVDEPVMIVGLQKELEYKAGQVWPHERRVIAIPKAGPATLVPAPASEPAPREQRSSIFMGSAAESRATRLIVAVVLLGLVVCVGIIAVSRGVLSGSRVHYLGILQGGYGLTANDDYWGVARKLGKPLDDRWQANTGEMQFRLLRYQDPPVTVVLMGIEQNDKARYIGALNHEGKVVDSVQLTDGRNTQALLHTLSGSVTGRK